VRTGVNFDQWSNGGVQVGAMLGGKDGRTEVPRPTYTPTAPKLLPQTHLSHSKHSLRHTSPSQNTPSNTPLTLKALTQTHLSHSKHPLKDTYRTQSTPLHAPGWRDAWGLGWTEVPRLSIIILKTIPQTHLTHSKHSLRHTSRTQNAPSDTYRTQSTPLHAPGWFDARGEGWPH